MSACQGDGNGQASDGGGGEGSWEGTTHVNLATTGGRRVWTRDSMGLGVGE